jgi:cytochrome c oxidase subunit 2
MLSACGTSTKSTDQSSNATKTVKKANKKADTKNVSAATKSNATANVVNIKVMAKDFEYDKKEIHVKKGDKVRLTLQSDDGGHGLTIPAFNVNIQGNKTVEFIADKSGTFEYHCSIFCGTGHAKMTGKLIVE